MNWSYSSGTWFLPAERCEILRCESIQKNTLENEVECGGKYRKVQKGTFSSFFGCLKSKYTYSTKKKTNKTLIFAILIYNYSKCYVIFRYEVTYY